MKEFLHVSTFFELVEQSIDAVIIIDASCRIRYVNPALERLSGYGLHELAGESLNGLLPESVARHHDAYVRNYLEGFDVARVLGKVRNMEIRHRTGALIPVEMKAIDLGMESGNRLFGAVMADRRRSAQNGQDSPGASAAGADASLRDLRRLQPFRTEAADILEQIARDAPLVEVLTGIVRMLEAYEPKLICSIMLLDADGRHLRHGAAPSLSSAYNEAIDGLEIGPASGSCGTAAFEKRHVVVADIATDPLWDKHRQLALSHGLRACWSMPVLSAAGNVLGAFAMYSLLPGVPDDEQRALHLSCSHLASVAIERHRATQVLRESEERFREQASLLDQTQDAIITYTVAGEITFWNKGAERLFGWAREDALGQSIKTLLYEESGYAEFDASTELLLEQGESVIESRVRDRYGNHLVMEARKSVVRDNTGAVRAILSALSDITARKKAENEIYHLAFYDQLTQLPNRRLLNDRIQHAVAVSNRGGQYGAVLMIDLDNFKTINDTLGHDTGDVMLRAAAQRLLACVRKCDTVARLGGDEFVVVLEELGWNADHAAIKTRAVAEKILAELAKPYTLAGYEHISTASIGISLFGHQPSSTEALLKEADLAMYRSKAEGRNTIGFFDPHMQVSLAHRSKLQAELRAAIGREELELYYQPQVDAHGIPYGVEALLRWRHPQRGFVPPSEFIALAEETGLMSQLGQLVLREACTALAAWKESPAMRELSLAVNVSMFQFRRPDFVESVLQVLRQTGADPRKLKLEITESVLADDLESTAAKMVALKAQGISFSLDDFGVGYSSLSYLKRLPLDQLKIDRSFVRDVLIDPNDASIARTIIALAHTLGLEVIAEGVETAEQRDLLLHNNCNAYQGYLFSEPLPGEELRKYMEQRSVHRQEC